LTPAPRRLRAQGAQAIELESWGDSAATQAPYEGAGFRPLRQAISYGRDV
jgi:hypothetical protein